MKNIALLTSAFALAISANANTQLYTFDSAGDLAGEFTTDSVNGVSENASSGLNGTRSLTAGGDWFGPQAVSVANAGAASFSTLSDFSITQSIFFRTRSGNAYEGGGQDAIGLGLSSDSSLAVGGAVQLTGNGGTRIATGIRITDADDSAGNDGSGNIVGTFGGSSTYNGGFFGFGGSISLSNADAWYLYENVYSYDSTNDEWDITFNIYDADSSGSVTPSAIATNTATIANTLTVVDNSMSIYGFFTTDNAQRANIAVLDNATLVAVPEPSSYALITGALALGFILVRRRG